MTILAVPAAAVGSLRQRLIDDMTLRRFSRETQRNYIRDVGRLATFLRRSPDTATVDDLRRFQIAQQEVGLGVPTMNAIVSALRFFFVHTIERPDLARRLVRLNHPRPLPDVLSPDEVGRLLGATVCLKHLAALSVAYGAGLRVAEVAALKVGDVDSTRMLLRVERGKGGRDRNAMLSADLLDPPAALVDRGTPAGRPASRGLAVSRTGLGTADQHAPASPRRGRGGPIGRDPQARRSPYPSPLLATHLLEDGVDIRVIQVLLVACPH